MKEEKREEISFKCKKRCVDTRRKNLYRHLNEIPRVSLPFSDSSVAYFVSEIASEEFFDSDLVIVRKRKRNTCIYREKRIGIKKSRRRETRVRGGSCAGKSWWTPKKQSTACCEVKATVQQSRRWTTLEEGVVFFFFNYFLLITLWFLGSLSPAFHLDQQFPFAIT